MKNYILSVIMAAAGFFIFSTPVSATSVVLNELLPTPSSGNDWVELYNPTASAVDLTNWILADSTSAMKTLSGTIEPNGFLVFEVSNRLNKDGDSVQLKDLAGSLIDNYSYESNPGTDFSFGRNPDGNSSWVTFTTPTKGASNNGASLAPTPTPTLTETPTPLPTDEPTSAPTPTPTTTPSPTPTKTPSPTPSKIPTPTKKPSPTPSKEPEAIIPSSLLGTSSAVAETPSPTPEQTMVAGFSFINILTITGGLVFILTGVLVFTFIVKGRQSPL